MKNEELRIKNWGKRCFPIPSQASDIVCIATETKYNACAVFNSSFLILSSSFLILATMLSGCTTFHARLNNSERLINRADFDAAVNAAPEWVEEALLTINNLELEIERQ